MVGRRRYATITLVVLLLVTRGCGAQGDAGDFHSPDNFTLRREREVMRSAPIVVVGRVVSVQTLQSSVAARLQPELLLDQLAVEIVVENRLRGDISSERLMFVVFVRSRSNKGWAGPPPFAVSIGDRRVFFLTRHQTTVRSCGDVLDYSLPVFTGSHRDDSIPKSDIGEAVARILLTPGSGYNFRALADQLPMLSSEADYFGSRRLSVTLLRSLLQESLPIEIRSASCFTLAEATSVRL